MISNLPEWEVVKLIRAKSFIVKTNLKYTEARDLARNFNKTHLTTVFMIRKKCYESIS